MMRRRRQRGARGSALLTALWVITALTVVVLVLDRSMRVEAMASANRVASAKAAEAEMGVEQYLLFLMEQEQVTPGTIYTLSLTPQNFAGRQIGDCYFWLLKPNPDDETVPAFGPTDEASKLDLNTAPSGMLEWLPNMDTTTVANIVGWRLAPGATGTDADYVLNNGGATDQDYLQLVPGYHIKNAPYESTEELMLVMGMTRSFMYGADTDENGYVDPTEIQNSPGVQFQTATSSARGLFPYVTAYGVIATNPPVSTDTSGTGGTTAATVIDPNTGASVTVADVNSTSTTNLQNILNQYLPGQATTILNATRNRIAPAGGGGRGGGGGGAARPFTNIWDWANTVGLTGQQFQSVYPFVVANPATGGAGGATTARVGKVNIMTASKQVLMCLQGAIPTTSSSTLTEQDVDGIIAYRNANNMVVDPSNIGWLLDNVADKSVLPLIGSYITGYSTCYSADIVVVSGDGRAFRRVRVVIDGAATPPQIIYRRDMGGLPFPLPAAIRNSLRSGKGLTDVDVTGLNNSPGNGL